MHIHSYVCIKVLVKLGTDWLHQDTPVHLTTLYQVLDQ